MTLLRSGDVVGARYRVLHPIARGGMGAVFEAEDEQLGRRVALKVLLPALLSDAQARERFRREARAVAAVRHEGLVGIHDLALDASPPYLVMELVDGESLRDVLAIRGRLPLREALALVADVLDTLAALHAAGIVHRDLKPANVLVTSGPAGPRAKLIDLGVAQVEDAGDTLTGTDVAVGTPAFMAPEQLAGQRVGPAADMWAAGVLLHTLLTGARPYAATTLAELVASSGPPPLRPIRESCPEAPPELDACVAGLLHPDAHKRPTEAAAVARQLRALAGRLALVGAAGDVGRVLSSEQTTVGASATPRGAAETPATAHPGPVGAEQAPSGPERPGARGVTVLRAVGALAVFGVLVVLAVLVVHRTPSPATTPVQARRSTTPEHRPDEGRAPSADDPSSSVAPFVYRAPPSRIVVLYGSAEEERSVAPLVEARVLQCFPSAEEQRLGLLAAYSVWFGADGAVDELREEPGGARSGPRSDAEDDCMRELLRDTTWPTSGLEAWFGRHRVTVSVAAWPPGAERLPP